MIKRIVALAIVSCILQQVYAVSPMPIDLELSMDVKTEEGKQSVFDIVKNLAGEQGFTCNELPTKTFGRDVLIQQCMRSSEHSKQFQSIVASDNNGLALFRIAGYFGGMPEPISNLMIAIERDVKQLGNITVRPMRSRNEHTTDPSEVQAQREQVKKLFEHWQKMCTETPSHVACAQRK